MKKCDLCDTSYPDYIEQCDCGSYVFSHDPNPPISMEEPPSSVAPVARETVAYVRLKAGHSIKQVREALQQGGHSWEEATTLIQAAQVQLIAEQERRSGQKNDPFWRFLGPARDRRVSVDVVRSGTGGKVLPHVGSRRLRVCPHHARDRKVAWEVARIASLCFQNHSRRHQSLGPNG